MRKTIKHIKIASAILIILQILIIISFTVLYFNDLFEVKKYITDFYIAIGAASLVAIDSLFVWIIYLRVSSLRQKTDLHAAEVIGNDIQEAYNFAMIGLAVVNEEDTVIWTNDLFKERHIDIIDLNILDWNPSLAVLKENNNPDSSTKTLINNRHYEVKYLPEAGLWIFKDITDFESIYAYNKEQAPVIGVLTIDNYDEVIRGDDDFNDLVTKVKSEIFAYAKEYGMLLRRIKDDTYSILCNFSSFTKMKNDRFSILDTVRNIAHEKNSVNNAEIPLTLSIGLARDFPSVVKLAELANEALDIAMSRGGDQVVVSVYGSEMEFYGGKTEAQEKRNRVKTRVLADSLISLLKSASNVLIMGHTEMDMDAFGACLGIKAICNRLEKNAKIVVDLKATEIKTRGAITTSFSKEETDNFIISSKEAENLVHGDTILVVVDVHTPNRVMAPKLLDKVNKVVVIDHHRRAEEFIENHVFNHIDAAASSACEIIAEFIRFSSINPRIIIPPSYATIMLSGIFLDSSYYKSKSTGIRTFEASTILKEYGADNALADDFLKDDFEEHKIVNDIVNNTDTPYYGVVIATADPSKIYDNATISKAANVCLTFKGNHASFVIGKISSNTIKVSARSDGTINVQLLLEKIGGGGHFSMAAAQFEKTDFAKVKESLINVLDIYLDEATNSKEQNREGE